MKLKKRLLFTAIGVLGLGATLTTTATLLTSCSQSANPYFPNTNINVTYNGQTYKYNYQNNVKDGFTIIDSNNQSITLGQLNNDIAEYKNANNQPIWTGNNINDVKGDSKFTTYTSLVEKYNIAYIVTNIFTYLWSLFQNLTTILAQTSPISSNIKVDDVSQYFTKMSTNLSKEFAIGILQGIGEGSNRYGLGIKQIDLEFAVDPTTPFSTIGDLYIDTNAPNIKINVTKFNITYGWYKELQNGGIWADQLNTVNNALTSSDQKILTQITGNSSITQLQYTTNFCDPTNKFVFNAVPGYQSLLKPDGSPASTDRYISGIYAISSPMISNPNFNQSTPPSNTNEKWIKSEKALPFSGMGLNYDEMYYLFNDLSSSNYLNSIKNNYNYLFYDVYDLICKFGILSSNSLDLPYDQISNTINNNNEYKTIKKWDGNITSDWNTLKGLTIYSNGITNLYNYFKQFN